MATEYELTLSDYLSIMRRRAPYLIGTFIIVSLVAVKVAFSIPPTYRSTGTIMVESPLVSDNTVPGAIRNDLDERINIIKQRIMARDNLLQMVRKYGLFKGDIGAITATDLLEKMRKCVVVEPISSNSRDGGQQTIAFTISFEDQHPEVSLKVATDLVNRFLQLNQSESMRARAESDLYDVERTIRFTNDELRTLEAELSGANARRGPLGVPTPPRPLPTATGAESPSQMLQTLKAEYARLSAVYTEAHPDVRALNRKIAALEEESKTLVSRSPEVTPTLPVGNFSTAAYITRIKVDAANAKLASLMLQKKVLQDKIAQYDHSIEQSSGLAGASDVNNADEKYEESRDQKKASPGAQNVDSETKSQRFSLLEAPILPDKPYKPNRPKILAMGFILAMALSAGMVMALESIDKRIRGTEALAHVLGYRPMVVIPYLPLEEEGMRRRRMLRWFLIAAAAILVWVLAAIHFLYMPLEILFVKILAILA